MPASASARRTRVDRERLVSIVATGIGGLHTLLGQWDIQRDKGVRRVSPLTVPMLMANAAGGQSRPADRRQGRCAHSGVGVRLQQ